VQKLATSENSVSKGRLRSSVHGLSTNLSTAIVENKSSTKAGDKDKSRLAFTVTKTENVVRRGAELGAETRALCTPHSDSSCSAHGVFVGGFEGGFSKEGFRRRVFEGGFSKAELR
jgi:hypothetical protein